MKELTMVLGEGDDKVVSLSLFKANREERKRVSETRIVGFGGSTDPKHRCQHQQVEVDTTLAELTCQQCSSKLNAIEWIANLVEHWHFIQHAIQSWHDSYTRAKALEAAVDLKTRTKCQHCEKLTKVRISSGEIKEAMSTEEMREALRTVGRLKGIGHAFDCSACQGSESDCTCGSAKVTRLLARLRWEK